MMTAAPAERAEPIFAEEADRIVVVTVYVYLNQREEPQ